MNYPANLSTSMGLSDPRLRRALQQAEIAANNLGFGLKLDGNGRIAVDGKSLASDQTTITNIIQGFMNIGGNADNTTNVDANILNDLLMSTELGGMVALLNTIVGRDEWATGDAPLLARKSGFITPQMSTTNWSPQGPSQQSVTHTHILPPMATNEGLDEVQLKLRWRPVSENAGDSQDNWVEYYKFYVSIDYLSIGGTVVQNTTGAYLGLSSVFAYLGHPPYRKYWNGTALVAANLGTWYPIRAVRGFGYSASQWSWPQTDIHADARSVRVKVKTTHVSMDSDDFVTLSFTTSIKGQIAHQMPTSA